MKAVLMSFGYMVSGPKSERFVHTMDEVEAVITELSVAEGYEDCDYTATELFAKAWKHEEGQTADERLADLTSSMRNRDWAKSYTTERS